MLNVVFPYAAVCLLIGLPIGISGILCPDWWWKMQAGKYKVMGMKPIKPASWDDDQASNGKVVILFTALAAIFILMLGTRN